MKRRYILSFSVCITVSLLLLQVWTLQYLLGWVEDGDASNVDKAKHIIEDYGRFLEAASNHGVPLFLTDKNVLNNINETHANERSLCAFFCQNKVLQLATVAQLSSQSQRETLMKELTTKMNYKITSFIGNDPSLLHHGLEVKIPFHYFLQVPSEDKIVHLIMLYERAGTKWWRGAIKKTILRDLSLEQKDLEYDAIYDKVEISTAIVDGLKTYLPSPMSSPTQQRFKECNYSTAHRFFDRYGKDQTAQAEEFQKKAWRLLAKVSRLLDKLKIPFWLSSGTCLGYFRQCSIISYSQDVDIGIFIKDFRPELVSTFSTHDIPLTHSFGHVDDSMEFSFRDGDIKLDIFFFYEDDNYMWNGGTQARTGRKFKYIFPKFSLCWTEFLELLVRVPCETESYIRANYGHNWFEPLKVWDWKKNPPNVEDNGIWPLDQWPEVIKLIPLPEQ